MEPTVTVIYIKPNPGCEDLIPTKAHKSDAAYDLMAATDSVVNAHDTVLIPLGFSMALPSGWEAQIRSRSGLAWHSGLVVANSPGTIDSGYRGEVRAIIHNQSGLSYTIKRGARIAQMVFKRVPEVMLAVAEELPDSDRGANGFGSTGV